MIRAEETELERIDQRGDEDRAEIAATASTRVPTNRTVVPPPLNDVVPECRREPAAVHLTEMIPAGVGASGQVEKNWSVPGEQ